MKQAKKRPNYAFVPAGNLVMSNETKRAMSFADRLCDTSSERNARLPAEDRNAFSGTVTFARANSPTSADDGTLIFAVKKPGVIRTLINRFRRVVSSSQSPC